MRHFIVVTDVGTFHTYAVSPAQAVNRVRYRMFGKRPAKTYLWEVREAEKRVA